MKSAFQNIIELNRVFARFKKIPNQSYYDFISFYKHYFNQISLLPFHEYIGIRLSYISALFHLDKLELFHQQCNLFLQELLNQPEFSEFQKRAYIDVLYLKAQAFSNESNSQESIKILMEIYRMDSENKKVRKKLFYLLYHTIQHQQKRYYGLIILSIILTLILTVISQLFIGPFYPKWLNEWMQARNILFLISMGFSLFLFGKTYFQTRTLLKNRVLKDPVK